MAKFRGTIQKNDLEGGFWQLSADDGTTYTLEGLSKDLQQAGARVELDGAVDKQAMSFTMSGPILKVSAGKRK